MAAREDRLTSIDQNIAANLRLHREAGNVSQEELAQRMSDRGFGFTQATIWKIESGQRPVRASELVALADSLQVMSALSLTSEPGAARHHVRLQQANRNAYDAYGALKEAAAAYLQTQIELAFAAREAHDGGLAVTEMHTSWLGIPAEQAAIEARIEADQEEAQARQVDDAVGKVLDALRTVGYEPALRIEDIQYEGGGPLPVSTPAQPADT
jgi:transcriptional regulator with XRE-family HTH domain